MKNYFNELNDKFESQIINVYKITEFDSDFLTLAIGWLEELEKNLRKSQGIENIKLLPTRTIHLLTKVRDQGPSRSKYQPVYNQSVVLLVSYFASAISDLFNDTLTHYLSNTDKLPASLGKEEFKFSLQEMSILKYDLSTEIGRMISRKSDLSFQDMGSIAKAFSRFFDTEIEWDSNVSNIIAAQACRHAIVHSGEIADNKCIKQLAVAKTRTIKIGLNENEKIAFDKDEIVVIGDSMKVYIRNISNLLLNKLAD